MADKLHWMKGAFIPQDNNMKDYFKKLCSKTTQF